VPYQSKSNRAGSVANAIVVIAAVLLITVLVSGVVQGADWYQWSPHDAKSQIEQLIGSAGVWGAGVSIGLMVLHSFLPFPAELLAIVNGMIYGPIWGTVITWVGAMLGAFAAFGLARALGQRFVHQLLTEKNAQSVDDWVASHGPGTLLLSRFIPVISFNLINYAAGLTKISWWHFAWTTGVGILPLTTLMVVMGDQIETLPWQIWLLLLGAGLVLWWGIHRLLPAAAPGHAPKQSDARISASPPQPFVITLLLAATSLLAHRSCSAIRAGPRPYARRARAALCRRRRPCQTL
jgi:uncharacterized membrane protein YdjX (TVP38/TMEM64 family)